MDKKEIKSNFKKAKKVARKEYHQSLIMAEEIYRAKKEGLEEEYNQKLSKYYESIGKPMPVNPPKRPILEEVGNSVTHGLGALFAIFAFVLMLLGSSETSEYIAAAIYFGGMFIMFTSSCLYHAFPHGSAVKRLFRRFDYSSIYLLIGATFAPVLLLLFKDIFGVIFFAVQWGVIACGICLVAIFGPSRLRVIHIPLYVILGWSALMLMPHMITVSFPLAMYILAGGVIYTLGIIPFMMHSRVSHFIWHFFVLAGAVVQWVGIYLYLFMP